MRRMVQSFNSSSYVRFLGETEGDQGNMSKLEKDMLAIMAKQNTTLQNLILCVGRLSLRLAVLERGTKPAPINKLLGPATAEPKNGSNVLPFKPKGD